MALEFQTFSIVAGNAYCNASCYFCVSKMTTSPDQAREISQPGVDWRNFRKASRLAQMSGVTTVLITGKGEPTLYPDEITEYLRELDRYEFPLIELQTNATLFQHSMYIGKEAPNHLQDWYDHGLNTIAISVVGIDSEQNRQVYLPKQAEYPSLERTVDMLHDIGYTIRLSVIGLKDHVDTPGRLEEVVNYCKEHGIEQLTWRPVTEADKTNAPEVNQRIEGARPSEDQIRSIDDHVRKNGTLLGNLLHGAKIYDLYDQNICLSDCLTLDPDSPEFRQLIFYSTGEVGYDWQYPGAIILGKGPAARDRAKRGTMHQIEVKKDDT